MKVKTAKKKLSELVEASERTMEYLGNDKKKVQQQAVRGLQSVLSKNPTPFDCRRCGTHFQPQPRQWIFYDLCDDCFTEFDVQKMRGRIKLLVHKQKTAYFEDVDAWMTAFPSPTR